MFKHTVCQYFDIAQFIGNITFQIFEPKVNKCKN